MAELETVFRCDCCQRVVASLKEDGLHIEGRHGGQEHITVITLDKLPPSNNNKVN